MVSPEIPFDEKERLRSLKEYSILDTLPEKEYDDITFLASQICNTPISLVSLIDDKRQWFKSNLGLDAPFTSRDISFCGHAINNKEGIFMIPDSREDIRFKDNPLVTEGPNVVFYAGIPLLDPDGHALGTLCVLDNKPNELNDLQIKALTALSNQLLKLLELRKNTHALHRSNTALNEQNKGLNAFVRVAAHDLKSPMSNIIMASELVLNEYTNNIDPDGVKLLDYINTSAHQLTHLVEGILRYSKDSSSISNNREDINILSSIDTTIKLLDNSGTIKYTLNIDSGLNVFCNKTALQQILVNLISNSIKYNDKDQPEITVIAQEENEFIRINIIDNGPGIKDEDKNDVFNLFSTTSNKDKDGFHGTGIGLATVKSLVEALGGTISLKSEVGYGVDFEFTLKK